MFGRKFAFRKEQLQSRSIRLTALCVHVSTEYSAPGAGALCSLIFRHAEAVTGARIGECPTLGSHPLPMLVCFWDFSDLSYPVVTQHVTWHFLSSRFADVKGMYCLCGEPALLFDQRGWV